MFECVDAVEAEAERGRCLDFSWIYDKIEWHVGSYNPSPKTIYEVLKTTPLTLNTATIAIVTPKIWIRWILDIECRHLAN